jgi:hypothetical protein
MALVTKIFLESKPVTLALGLAGHLYLVLRTVEVDENGDYGDTLLNPSSSTPAFGLPTCSAPL